MVCSAAGFVNLVREFRQGDVKVFVHVIVDKKLSLAKPQRR